MSTTFVFFEQTFIRMTNTITFFAEFSTVFFIGLRFGKEIHFIPCTFVHFNCDILTEQHLLFCYTIKQRKVIYMSYKSMIQRNLGMIFFVTIGLIAGFLYYKYIGCVSGTCPITANPIISVLYGGILGGLFHSIITEIFIPMSKRKHLDK